MNNLKGWVYPGIFDFSKFSVDFLMDRKEATEEANGRQAIGSFRLPYVLCQKSF